MTRLAKVRQQNRCRINPQTAVIHRAYLLEPWLSHPSGFRVGGGGGSAPNREHVKALGLLMRQRCSRVKPVLRCARKAERLRKF